MSGGGVFMDRDGTLCELVSYLDDPERARLLPGAADAVRLLNAAGVPAVVVTNQSGVGRGYFTAEIVEAIHERIRQQLAAGGAAVDAFYTCPHRPDEGCDCRKPAPGLLRQAAAEHELSLEQSFLVGDTVSDIQAGQRAGCRTVLVLTGHGERERELAQEMPPPDHVADDLLGAVAWILARMPAKAVADA